MKVTYSAKANIIHRTQQLEDGRSVEVISLTQAEHAQDAQLVLEWSFPILDIAGRWLRTADLTAASKQIGAMEKNP